MKKNPQNKSLLLLLPLLLVLLIALLFSLPFISATPTALAIPSLLIGEALVPEGNRPTMELFFLEKDVFVVGESLPIRIVENPEFLEITGPNTTYKYLGVPYDPLLFVPKEAGVYTITATTNGYEDKKSFTAIKGVIPKQRVPVEIRSVEEETPDPLISFIDDQNRVLITKKRSTLEKSLAFEIIQEGEELLTAVIRPSDDLFEELVLRDVKAAGFSLGIDRPPKENIAEDYTLRGNRLVATYAVDPSGMNFTHGTLSRVAQGSSLYKCVEWNFTEQRCFGRWEKYKDIVPGKEYTVLIDSADPAFVEVGVATINAKKPIYKPGEEAQLLMAILDTEGFLVTGANITLEITSPSGIKTFLSTTTDDIQEINLGVYETYHTSFEEGIYSLFVQATAGGVKTFMTSNYTINSSYAFDIFRETPMTIDPWKGAYSTTILIEPQNATGGLVTVQERLPSAFTITDPGGALISVQGNDTLLTWQVGTGIPVTYYAQAPLVTPDLYGIGPAKVIQGALEFIEARVWWLAIDPTDALDPIVHVNTEVVGVDLTSTQVNDISTDDTAYVTFTNNTVLTVELSNPGNVTPIASVSSLSCSVTYTSQAFSPDATFRVDDSFGGNVLGNTTLATSTGGDATVTLSNLQNDANFNIPDLTTLNVYIRNNDAGQPQTISIDDVWCTVSYTETDIESPVVALQDPLEGAYLGTSILQFNYTPSDNVDFANCTLIIDGSLNASNSSAIVNGSVNSITESFADAAYNWTVRCEDGSANIGTASETRNFTVDTTNPSVELTEPTDVTETGSGAMQFNITVTDTNLQNCTLYGDFNGSWLANSTITVADNLTSGIKSSFLPVDLVVGFYAWNAYCVDIANNVAFAPANFSVNITPPDLTLTSNDIVFPSGIWEDKNITINATIFNTGFTIATNFIVQFFLGDPDVGGVQIAENKTVTSLAHNENITVNVTYIAPIGPSNIFVDIDRNNSVAETNEGNNKANTTLNVNSYNRIYGNTSTNITLDAANNATIIDFVTETNTTGSLFFARGGSSIDFASLIPIGKTTTDLNTSNDFSDADNLLNMTTFSDNVNSQWANNTDRPINISTFTINKQLVNEVPVINSDIDGDFLTGILWDSSDDVSVNLEYDITDKEDLVFIANSEEGLIGSFGIQDYEAIIPARLREYAGGPIEMIEIYFELT